MTIWWCDPDICRALDSFNWRPFITIDML